MVVDFSVPRKAMFRIAVVMALLQIFCPGKLFPQTGQDLWDRSRRVLDYQFDRADRQLSPGRWMEEARLGITNAQAVWAEMAPEIFTNSQTLAVIGELTEQELEKRFTRWLLERFFGAAVEVPAAGVFRETGDADKYLIYFTGPDGSVLYDPATGDPRIIRPGDEGHDFAGDLSSWKQKTSDAAERELQDYRQGIRESYPELLEYIAPGREEEFGQKLAAAGEGAAQSLKLEFEAVLAREERYFTAQRLGDVWSLRKKSEDQSAGAIGDRLIEEARQVCDTGIAAIEAKIEAARNEEGDVVVAGTQWLDEYREQFERGLKAWESAEERFLVRYMQWEQSSENTFTEGMETWNNVFARFEEERRNWEDRARVLFLEGEEYFAKASEVLESAIAAAKAEYEKDSVLRIGAASERTGALAGMYVLSASAAEEAGKNVEFWIKKYGELHPDTAIPAAGEALEAWVDTELTRLGAAADKLETLVLEELKNWSLLYRGNSERAEESRLRLLNELYSITGFRDDSGAEMIFNPDYYETELIRAGGELDYWKNRSAIAEAVVAYAEALDAGRISASESLEAWEKALASYNEASAAYGAAEDSLKAGGADLSAARDAIVTAAGNMRAADAALEKLRQNYQVLASVLGSQGEAFVEKNMTSLNEKLTAEQELLGSLADTSPWGKFLAAARELEAAQLGETRKGILAQLIAGDEDSLESLAGLAQNASNAVFPEAHPLLDLAEAMLGEEKISAAQYALFLSVLNDGLKAQAENQLDIRLAAISLILENSGSSDWYFSVNHAGTEENPPIQNMEAQLLSDWEWNRLEHYRARAELELAVLDFLEGKETGEAAALLASLYTGDEIQSSQDRETLEAVLELVQSLIDERSTAYTTGILDLKLTAAAADNTAMLSFLAGNSLIDPLYGQSMVEAFLKDYVRREEFSGNLYNTYLGFGALSPAVIRENQERGFRQLGSLWETLGIETGDSIFPETETIINILTHLDGDGNSWLSPLLYVLDEIFYDLLSIPDPCFSMWKENLISYCASPSEDILAQAERHAGILNGALQLLKDEEKKSEARDFETEAQRYRENPLLEWDDSAFNPEETASYDDYESAGKELQDHYSSEVYLKGEINRLLALAGISKQNASATEEELAKASADVTQAENEYQLCITAYQDAAEKFRLAGNVYDALYGNTEDAFRNLVETRKIFETQDAVRQWAETAYLDSRKPAEELLYCREREDRAFDALELLKSIPPDNSRNQEYLDAYDSYRENLSLFTQSLEALTKLERAIESQQEKTGLAYRIYQEQLSLMWGSFDRKDDYISPADKKTWNIQDVITVDNGYLVFARDNNNVLSGSDKERSEILKNYFTPAIFPDGEYYSVSSFELTLRELSAYLSDSELTRDDYIQLGLARDYLMNVILKNNPGLGGNGGWYNMAESLKSSGNLGNMILMPGPNIKVSSALNDAIAYTNKQQEAAWNSLDAEAKRMLEMYTILTLFQGGGTNSGYFSHISEYLQYNYIYSMADYLYNDLRKMANKAIIGKLYQNDLKVIKATRTALTSPTNELNNNITLGFYGLTGTLSSLTMTLDTYRETSEKLVLLEGKSEESIRWEDIEKALALIGGIDEDLSSLKGIWESLTLKQGKDGYDIPGALRQLADACGNLKDASYRYLCGIWEAGEDERANHETAYMELYGSYMDGSSDLKELEAAAALSFGGISATEHLGNIGNALMENLVKFSESGLGGTTECALLAGQYAGLVNKAWEEKYTAELTIRGNEWDIQRKDIQEKFIRWQESAAAIMEKGRISWKEGDEKLQEARSRWIKTFEEEYGRIKDGWTAAYLEGLQDKEAWAAAALEAAGQASSAAVLAMMGSNAEAGARAMDTRDPLGFMNIPDMREGEKILAELLEKSGTGYLAAAFGSIRASPETLAAVVRTGLGGGGVWSSGAIIAEAAILAGTVREEFQTRETQKLAFTVMDGAKNAYKMLEGKLRLANDSFRKNMDETFIMRGQWSRAGTKYIKDVIVHSTLFDSVITDYAEVEGFRNFVFPLTSLSSYMDDDPPQNLTSFQADALIDSVISKLSELDIRIFGVKENGFNGEFQIYLGKEPDIKSKPDVEKGRSGVFNDQGAGETGRLLADFYFWMLKEQMGIALVNAAPWEKPMWDSRGSAIEAPSIKSAVNLALQTGIIIAGVVAAPLTAGTSVIGSIAMKSALSSASDLMFAGMDIAGGYKTWKEAGVEFGKSLIVNTVSSAASAVLYGIKGIGEASSFFNSNGIFGSISGIVGNNGFSGVISKTITSGLYAATTSIGASLVNSVTYNSSQGFGFSGDYFKQGLTGGGIGALSAMAGTFTGGIMDLGLKGFVSETFANGQKLSNFTGGLASQGVKYAFGEDFTLNILNAGMFLDKEHNVNAGLMELSFGSNGAGLRLGSGGADASIGTLIGAAMGLDAWRVNAQMLFSSREATEKYTSQLRTLYSMGAVNRDEYNNVLAGKTIYEENRDVAETQSIYDKTTGIKTVYLGSEALNDDSSFGLNVIFSHEAYRDGTDNGEAGQILERNNAVTGHIATEIALMGTYGIQSLGAGMVNEAALYNYASTNNDSALMDAIFNRYDSSADFWKLQRNGNLVNDNSGWLTYENGTPVLNAEGKQIGASGIETGLLNILFGGTSNLAYSAFSDAQIQQAQGMMIMAGMAYQEGTDGTARSRTWAGNEKGIALNMNSVMLNTGNTIASQVFASYYDASVDSNISWILGKDIGGVTKQVVAPSALDRYFDLFKSKLDFYTSAGSFVDLSKGYYISGEFGVEYDGHYVTYNYKHYGFDLSREGGPSGDSLFAGIAGTVSKTNWNYAANGNDIQIEYGYQFENSFIGSGIFGEYLHMKDASTLPVGTSIGAATQIGQIAGTPNYDPHLHYDILTQNGNYSQSTLAILLGTNTQANSFKSSNGVNTVYNPLLYYNNFLGKQLYSKNQYMALKK